MPASNVLPDIKAAALADLQAGEQPAIVAQRYGLDPGKVRMWKTRYVADGVAESAIGVAPVSPVVKPSVGHKQNAIGELVLDLLAAKLKASAAIAQAASDPAWLAKQRGSELAALGQWLDSTALAIGDRLAQRDDGSDSDP